MDFITEKNRIYSTDESGQQNAVIEFPEEKPGVVNITHTQVDSSLRGQGVAGKLTKACADQLRSDGRKAVLTCSYAVRWFEKHPEYSDVLLDPAQEKENAAALAGEACGIDFNRKKN